MTAVDATLAAAQQGVEDGVEQPSGIADAFQGRTITPAVHFDIGFSTATLIDEPVIGFGADAAEEPPLPPARDGEPPRKR